MKKILLLGLIVFSMGGMLMAQDQTVTGKVTAQEDGSALPGVNVIVKGTSTGTITDMEGAYSISVPAGSTLTFSFVGYASQEIAINSQSIIDVVLSADVTQLGEVVVTALGIEREKRALGYGVETVDGEKVAKIAEPDAIRGLQGKVAGVNIVGSSGAPGSSTRITIRGNSSLLGSNQPLIVVDGVAYNNSENGSQNQLTGGGAYGSRLSDLDPNNIETINILKSGAAASLYGSRAANGVIMITTKTGSSGKSKKGLEMGFNTSYSIEKIANLPDYQNTYGTGTNYNYQQANGSWGAPFIGSKPYASRDSIPHWYNGIAGFEDLWGTNVPYKAYPNNVKDFFQTGRLIENSLSIKSGNENLQLNAVVSNTNHEGYVPNTKFERTSASVGIMSQLENGFNVGANLSYSNTFQHSFQGGANNAIGNASAFARTLYLGRNWDLQGQPFQNPVSLGSVFFVDPSQADSPEWSIRNAGNDSKTDRWNANLSLGYDILEWLNVSYRIGLNGYTQRTKDWFRPGSRGANGSGQFTSFDIAFQEIDSYFLVNINKDLSEDISLNVNLGNHVNQRTTESQSVQGTGYVVFDLDNINNTNAVVPNGGGYARQRNVGFFAEATGGYKDFAFITASGRMDQSSTLPTENNTYFYPSVSGSLVFTDAFDIQSSALNFGKIKVNWSQVGSDTGPYQLAPFYNVNSNGITSPSPDATALPFNGVAGATLTNTEFDPNLKPEITNELEIGAEMSFLNNRLGLDVAVYDKKTFDQIVSIGIPSTSGFSNFLTNLGEVSNRGLEVTLKATPIQTQSGFTWDFTGTFTKNINKIESLVEGIDEVLLRPTFAGSVSAVHIVGEEYGLIKGTVSARDSLGNLLIDPSNGQLISDLTPRVIGNPNPDFMVGFTNSFNYKGFTLTAVVDWRQGGDLYSVTNLSLLGRGVTKDTEDREKTRIIPGVYGDPNTGKPILDENGELVKNTTLIEENALWFGNSFAINAQDEWSVWDATTIRLREVSLGYTIPQSVLDKTPFGSINISFVGRNLWYNAPNFPEASNFDPEVSQFGASNAQGFEFNSAPSVKRYGFNLSLTF